MRNQLILFLTLFVIVFSSCRTKDTVVDIDGNVYHTVKIGTQTWFVENLKVTHYRNGDTIPNVTDSSQWNHLKEGAYCNYNNDTNLGKTYGRLYNGYSVLDKRNICPSGWHISNNNEWDILGEYIDSTIDLVTSHLNGTILGNKLKESGTNHWINGKGSTNSSGFTALPGGYRSTNGSFGDINNDAHWWASPSSSTTTRMGVCRYVYFSAAPDGNNNQFKNYGFSIRCIKDN